MKSARNPKMGTGAIPASMFPRNSTARTERVSQAESVSMLAAKKMGQLVIAKSKPVMTSITRPEMPDIRRTMSQQEKCARKGASMLVDKRPYGSR